MSGQTSVNERRGSMCPRCPTHNASRGEAFSVTVAGTKTIEYKCATCALVWSVVLSVEESGAIQRRA